MCFSKSNYRYILLFLFVALLHSEGRQRLGGNNTTTEASGERLARMGARDTVFVLGDRYVVIDLVKQTATLHRRGDTASVFPVSSGTKYISKGMNTPIGLYTVQSRSPLAISRQFDNAKLFSWVGFHGNIGFHGLEGNGYYQYLGKKPSSHGCIRIGREDGKALYQETVLGTPVLVHKEEPARILAFGDSTILTNTAAIALTHKSPEIEQVLEQRLRLLYRGELYLKPPAPLYLDGKTVVRPGGFALGERDSIAPLQLKPLDQELLAFRPGKSDRLRADAITSFLPRSIDDAPDEQDMASSSAD